MSDCGLMQNQVINYSFKGCEYSVVEASEHQWAFGFLQLDDWNSEHEYRDCPEELKFIDGGINEFSLIANHPSPHSRNHFSQIFP